MEKFGEAHPVRKSHARLLMLVAMLCSAGATLSAASANNETIKIEPGDPRITGDTTLPRSMRWSVTRIIEGAPPEPRGVWMDRHDTVEQDGRILHKHQSDVVWATGRPRRDIIYWDAATMETVSAELENYNNKGGWAYLLYDKNNVSQIYRREPFGETFSESVKLERRVFEIGHGLFLAHILDLKPGGKIRYPYHERTSNKVKWMTVEANDYEEIETQNYGVVTTLPLESDSGWTYWTVPEPPYLYRLDIKGAENAIDRWELLEYFVEDPSPSK